MDNGRTNRSAAAMISRTLENALQYIRGTGEWFSARNETAVISQLIEAQKELDKLQAVVDAARALVALDTFHMYDRRTMQAYDELKAKLAAYEQGVSGE